MMGSYLFITAIALLVLINTLMAVFARFTYKKYKKKLDKTYKLRQQSNLNIFIQNLKQYFDNEGASQYRIAKALKSSKIDETEYMYVELLLNAVLNGSYEALLDFIKEYEDRFDELEEYKNYFISYINQAYVIKKNNKIIDGFIEQISDYPQFLAVIRRYLK